MTIQGKKKKKNIRGAKARGKNPLVKPCKPPTRSAAQRKRAGAGTGELQKQQQVGVP